jgi:prepilin-type N-terminal cleavage/methylation domain-containing protein
MPHASRLTPSRKKGFTLSELLISLSILGVIAALTLPGVFTHMQVAGNKAKLKSNVTAVHQALNADVLDGTYVSIAQTLTTRLNYAHLCPPNNVTPPCDKAIWHSTAPHDHYTRVIMHDGSIIWDAMNYVLIKVEQKEPNYATNALFLRYNPTNATLPPDDWFPESLAPGMLQAHNASLLYNSLYD